jgi:hypothetical protein
MTTNDGTVGRYLGWFLVALSLGSGVIHFAVAGEHFDVTWYHGTFFAVVAWLQLVWAAALIVRPTRQLLALGALGNFAIIVVWFVSRMWGLPVGPEAGHPEPVALSTMALSPSFASDHHHGEAAHSHGTGEEAAHSHDAGEAAGAPSHDAATGGHQEGHTDVVITADGSSPCEQSGVANEGNSGHGHRGPVADVPMDPATRDEFRAQTAAANAAVARYPTVADAEAAGYTRITPYVPCIAAHYIKQSALLNPFDPNEPEILLMDGTNPDSHIVGLSYLVLGDPDQPPAGFAGDIDTWHVHETLCVGRAGVVGDESTTEEQCEERGGRVIPLGNLWMAHMWNAAGWPSVWGLFSSENPELGGTIGDINGTPGG